MNKKKYRYFTFIKSHNLVNRIYDMLNYFGLFKNPNGELSIKKFLSQRLADVDYVESLAKYFEQNMRKYKKNVDLKCNLRDLIYDLEYLKQYLL